MRKTRQRVDNFDAPAQPSFVSEAENVHVVKDSQHGDDIGGLAPSTTLDNEAVNGNDYEQYTVDEGSPVVTILDESVFVDQEQEHEESFPPDNSELYESKLTNNLKRYLKREVRASRGRLRRGVTTAKFIKNLFGSDLEDPGFFHWLALALSFKTDADFRRFMLYADTKTSQKWDWQRRKSLSSENAKLAYTFWKENSIISVDRRNIRNVVRVSPKKIYKPVRDIDDDNVKTCIIKMKKSGNEYKKLAGHRHIYTKAVTTLYNIFIEKHRKVLGESPFYRCKPFYINPPT